MLQDLDVHLDSSPEWSGLCFISAIEPRLYLYMGDFGGIKYVDGSSNLYLVNIWVDIDINPCQFTNAIAYIDSYI